MKLYEMQDNLMAIDSILEKNTDSESYEILESARETLMQDIDNKCENILGYISECKAKAEYYKNEIERLAGKKKVLENRVEWLKKLIFGHLQATGRTKAEYGTWSCSIAKTPPKIIIDDETNVPDYCKHTVVTIDKAELKKCMLENEYRVTIDGKDVLIAHMEQGESLRIR